MAVALCVQARHFFSFTEKPNHQNLRSVFSPRFSDDLAMSDARDMVGFLNKIIDNVSKMWSVPMLRAMICKLASEFFLFNYV